MTINTTAVNRITTLFPTLQLTLIVTITSKPMYSTLCIVQKQMNGNAAASVLNSNGGDDIHGHLSLAMPTDKYKNVPKINM
jgi:hypothetical protein